MLGLGRRKTDHFFVLLAEARPKLLPPQQERWGDPLLPLPSAPLLRILLRQVTGRASVTGGDTGVFNLARSLACRQIKNKMGS